MFHNLKLLCSNNNSIQTDLRAACAKAAFLGDSQGKAVALFEAAFQMSFADFVMETVGILFAVDLDTVSLALLFELLPFFEIWIYEVG